MFEIQVYLLERIVLKCYSPCKVHFIAATVKQIKTCHRRVMISLVLKINTFQLFSLVYWEDFECVSKDFKILLCINFRLDDSVSC